MTEVESDGSVTFLRRAESDVLQLTITEPPPTTAPIDSETISGGLIIHITILLTIVHVLLCVSVLQISHQLVECRALLLFLY